MNEKKTLISIVMGSTSDYETMQYAEKILQQLDVCHQTLVVSAHRTPERLYSYAKSAKKNDIEVIIAGAGGAAHLPGMVASLTSLPVLAVPISTSVCGIDSLLSIVQMPQGTPVATFSIGKAGAYNAALFACKILGTRYIKIQKAITEWKQKQAESVPFAPRQNSE